MRELKFRVYTSEEGMIYNSVDCFISFNSDGTINNTGHPTHHVMQFTGIRDKNGKDIYEGDIINIFYGHPSWINTPFEVVFIMGSFCMKKPDMKGSTAFTLYLHDCYEQGITTVDSDDSFLFEVIGNIYQNHELLQS